MEETWDEIISFKTLILALICNVPVAVACSLGRIFDSMIPLAVIMIIFGIIVFRFLWEISDFLIPDFKEGIDCLELVVFILTAIFALVVLCAIVAGVYIIAKDVYLIFK